MWSVNSGEYISGLAGHTDRVLALQQLPDGRIASGGVEGVVYLWRPSTCARELSLATGGKVVGMAALPGATLATAGLDSVKIWSTASGLCLHSIPSGKVVCCGAQADGRLVTGHDAMLRVWNPLDGTCVRTSKGRRAAAQAVLPLMDGRIVTAAPDGCIRVWSASEPPTPTATQARTPWARLAIPTAPISNATLRGPFARRLLSPDRRSHMRTSSLGRPPIPPQSHSDRVSCIVSISDGRVVSASWDSTLRIWCAVAIRSTT